MTHSIQGEQSRSQQTQPGNYFVSNYPPYSFWTPEQVPKAFTALDAAPKPGNPLGIYLHIPFCRKRCHFCYFKVYTGVKSAEIRTYLEATIKEISLYRERKCVRGRKPLFVYFGGGTPSFLSTKQLLSLTEKMKAAFPWEEAEEITFECEPGTLTERKLQTVKDIGVTRLSLGVENFDDHILEINGRAHRSKEILRAYEWARQANFPQINIDLIAGMLEEDSGKWEKTVAKAVSMEPDCVTIYQMEIPFNTTIYKRMKENGLLFAPIADWQTKKSWVDYAFTAFEHAGYTITSAYTAVKNPRKLKFLYRDHLWKGADLMSLGVASFSHMNGIHYQNNSNLEYYLACLEKNELPIYRALAPSDEELMIRELILQFKLGKVDRKYFYRKFNVDIDQRFSHQIFQLKERGALIEDRTGWNLSRKGLLEVDAILHEFFLERHKHRLESVLANE